MKNLLKLLPLVLCVLMCQFVFGQDTTKSKQSKFEEFSSEDGVLKKIESHKIGKIKGFVMFKKTVTNVETGKFYNAVEISEKGGWLSVKFGNILIDEDEIPSLIKTLKFFETTVLVDVCKDECPSYFYETKSGVYIFANKLIGAYANAWHVYISKSLYSISSAVTSIDIDNPKELDNFIKLLESYK